MILIITFWPPRPLALTMVKKCWYEDIGSKKTPSTYRLKHFYKNCVAQDRKPVSFRYKKVWWLSTFFHPIPPSHDRNRHQWKCRPLWLAPKWLYFLPDQERTSSFYNGVTHNYYDSSFHIDHSQEVEREYKQVHNNLKCRDVCCTLQVETQILTTTCHTFDLDLWPWPLNRPWPFTLTSKQGEWQQIQMTKHVLITVRPWTLKWFSHESEAGQTDGWTLPSTLSPCFAVNN